jgi:shikimate 5-dehydrogenase
MLLHQGALAFRLWTGRSAPLAEMRRALAAALGGPAAAGDGA